MKPTFHVDVFDCRNIPCRHTIYRNQARVGHTGVLSKSPYLFVDRTVWTVRFRGTCSASYTCFYECIMFEN